MTKLLNMAMVALLAVAFVGCGGDTADDKKADDKKDNATTQVDGTTPVSIESEPCGSCGDGSATTSCCQSEGAKSEVASKTPACCQSEGAKSEVASKTPACCQSKPKDEAVAAESKTSDELKSDEQDSEEN